MLSEDDLVAAIAAVAGVHFDPKRMSPADIGHRAAAASLSDMAAMGAEPVCLLAAVGVPEGFAAMAELAAGMAEHGVAVVGGDLSYLCYARATFGDTFWNARNGPL